MTDKTYEELLDDLESYNERTAIATATYEAGLSDLSGVISGAEDQVVELNDYVSFSEEWTDSDDYNVTTPEGKVVRSISGANADIDAAIDGIPGSLLTELKAIARSLNVPDSAVIYSTDTTTVLDDIAYIYNASVSKAYITPVGIGAGEKISSVDGLVLTTDSSTYQLQPVKEVNSEGTANVMDYGAVGDGEYNLLSDTYATLVSAWKDYPAAISLSDSKDWAAFQSAINTGKDVIVPKPYPSYMLNRELLFITESQSMTGAGAGTGKGKNFVEYYLPKTALTWFGTGIKYLHTRRNPKPTEATANDDSISTNINIEAEGVTLKGFDVLLETNFNSNSSYGADWDVGIFNGCRARFTTEDVHIVAYHRMANMYTDVTRAYLLPELSNPEGIKFPVGTSFSGCDNITHNRPVWVGGRWAEVILGAILGDTGFYWNEETEALVSDNRGGSGCSNYEVNTGEITGGEHHSNRRWADPDSTSVPISAMDEGFSSGAQWLDARAGISSDRMSKQTYNTTRIVSEQVFITRLDRTSNVKFIACHWEWENREILATDGVTEVDPSDMDLYGYGTISVTPNTGSVVVDYPSTNIPSEEHFWSIGQDR